MNVMEVSSWEESKEKLNELIQSKQEISNGKRHGHVSNLLYRGQSNANWRLTTTLERHPIGGLPPRRYYQTISSCRALIEAFTDRSWDIPTWDETDLSLLPFSGTFEPHMRVYEYMAYLRHNGFPSPLLDWSRSMTVAAFFAFQGAHNSEKVAMFVFLEFAGMGKIGCSETPAIISLGPNVRTHKRHFLQQSKYTICVERTGSEAKYAGHDDAFDEGRSNQDLLWKIVIPSHERQKVLHELDSNNINAFSLFGSEESLFDTVATRVLESPTR